MVIFSLTCDFVFEISIFVSQVKLKITIKTLPLSHVLNAPGVSQIPLHWTT